MSKGIINSVMHTQLRGSFDDTKKFIEFLQEYLCSSGQIKQVLNTFFIYLNLRTHLTSFPLASLLYLLISTITNLTCKEFSQVIVNHLIWFWCKLWSWLKHFHNTCIINLVTGSSEEWYLFKSTFIEAIYLFTQEEQLAMCLWSTPEVILILINIWCLEIAESGISLSETSGLPGTWLPLYFRVMHKQGCQLCIDNIII